MSNHYRDYEDLYSSEKFYPKRDPEDEVFEIDTTAGRDSSLGNHKCQEFLDVDC